jgi:hypothetical protein
MLASDQVTEIGKRLKHDYGMKEEGDYLRKGECPECKKRELFISMTEPHHLKCGREKHCGWGINTRELYPDIWKPLEEQHPPTKADPNATARAYLKTRKIDPDLFKGQFIQAQRVEREAIGERKHTETVRFFLNADKSVWWERFIVEIPTQEKPKGKKSHFPYGASFKGLWWQPVGFDPANSRDKRVFLVEGILDALSLIQSGFHAVSLMSCSNWPEQAISRYLGQGIKWVLALDNDTAGKKYIMKHYRELVRRGESVEVCIAPDKDKRDWNDLLKESGGRIRETMLEDWFYTGSLLTASNAKQKALLIQAHTGEYKFTLDYGHRLYYAEYSDKEEDDPIRLARIANCKPEFLYFQKDALVDDKDSAAYYLRVTRPNGKFAYKGAFSSSSIKAAAEFKERLLSLGAGLMFTGKTEQLVHYQEEYWFDREPIEVKTVNFLGYARELGGWIFPGNAVFDGVMHQVNDDDFISLPDGRNIKTTFRQDTITIGTVEDAHRPDLWLDDFKTAFGFKGLAALAFWAGSYFVEQIRAPNYQQSYPFLELSGEPGAGKSTILELLWRLTGRLNYEGIDLAKATAATRRRSMEQLANLPLVGIEMDRTDNKGNQKKPFDLADLKTLYNGRGIPGTSPKNQGNETKEPPFRASLIIAQNATITDKPEIMQRIVKVHWDKSHFSDEGRAAADRLKKLEMGQINGFMTACITQEKRFLDKYEEGYQAAMQKLSRDNNLGIWRLRHNHAQLMGVIHALKATGILSGLQPGDLEGLDNYLHQCCTERHQSLEADSPMVAEFWDLFDYLEGCNYKVNHSKEPARIAIRMNEFARLAAEVKQPVDLTLLKNEVKQSKRYPFIGNDKAWSVHEGKTVSCFIFSNKEGARLAMNG